MNFHYRLLAILALYILSIFTGYHLIDDPKQNTSVVAILVLALMPIIIMMFGKIRNVYLNEEKGITYTD